MPHREDGPGRVDVAVVSDTALTASPLPHSQPIDTLRPAERATGRSGAGGVRLVDFHEDNACVIAFIFQHCFQLAPAGIEYRLGHGGFNEFGAADIAQNNQCIVVHQLTAELMQVVVTAVF